MKMRMTNVPFQATSLSPLVPNSTRESLSIMEKNHAIDLTGFVIMCLDVWYGKTSNFSWFTRCGVDVTTFRVMDWSKNLGVICNDDPLAETTLTTTIRKWNAETREDIEVEFIDVDISDINDMINWLRITKDIFYAPPKERKEDGQGIEPLSSTFYCCDSKLVTETQRLQEENKKLKTQLAAKDTQINELKRISKTISKDKDDLLKFRSEIVELSGLGLLCGPFDENSKKIIGAMKALREFRKEVIKRAGVDVLERDDKYILEELDRKLKANDFYVESEWEADYRKFVQRIFEAVGTPCYDEVIHTNYLALQALEDVKKLKEALKCAKEAETWYIKTNRNLVMERDRALKSCEDLAQDINEWQEWFDSVCEELDTPARDFATVLNELKRICTELDNLAEFKAKLAELIKLPEDKKDGATTRDYISCFEHTKKEWSMMEIKLKNYETENKHLLERNHALSASNGAFDVLRSLHGSIIGLCDIDDCPQIIGARIIDKFNRVKAEKEELKENAAERKKDYANAICARAELAYLYKKILDVDDLDPELSPHEIAVRIRKRMRELEEKQDALKQQLKFSNECLRAEWMNSAEWASALRTLYTNITGKVCVQTIDDPPSVLSGAIHDEFDKLRQKLNDIKDICDGNSDVMNIIGE